MSYVEKLNAMGVAVKASGRTVVLLRPHSGNQLSNEVMECARSHKAELLDELARLTCRLCPCWEKISTVSGLCTFTGTETSVLAKCVQIDDKQE